MSKAYLVLGALSLTLLAMSDASAMCCGGGMAGGQSRGGSGLRVTGHGGCGQQAAEKESFRKWALPAAETVSTLDFTKLEGVLSRLDLNTEQAKKIGEAKTEVSAESARLARTQDEKRAAYQQAACEASARVAASEVIGIAALCKAFDAQARFTLALGNILNAEQMKKYRELIAKA